MRRALLLIISLPISLLLVAGCVTPEKQTQSSSVAALPSKPTFDRKSSSDSVNWASLNKAGKVPQVKETDLEWPGERIGLIGPIVASGKTEKDEFLIVYDPAGIPVGLLTRTAYQENPTRLAELLAKAQVRSELQNLATLSHLAGNPKENKGVASAKP